MIHGGERRTYICLTETLYWFLGARRALACLRARVVEIIKIQYASFGEGLFVGEVFNSLK